MLIYTILPQDAVTTEYRFIPGKKIFQEKLTSISSNLIKESNTEVSSWKRGRMKPFFNSQVEYSMGSSSASPKLANQQLSRG